MTKKLRVENGEVVDADQDEGTDEGDTPDDQDDEDEEDGDEA